MKSIDHNSMERWMSYAILEAKKSQKIDEVPVGAIIVLNNEIVGRGFNQPIRKKDPTSHAEIEAIRNASKNIGNYRLVDAEMYVTLEPCTMCYGAIVHSRMSSIFYGASDPKTGVCRSCDDLSQKSYFNHQPKIIGGILEGDSSRILKEFFSNKRN